MAKFYNFHNTLFLIIFECCNSDTAFATLFNPSSRIDRGHAIFIRSKPSPCSFPKIYPSSNATFAFLCMNVPYTMTVDQAASAVLEMKPKIVIPYHYRGKGGFSDLEKFKSLVGQNNEIQVKLLPWYP